MIVVFVRDVGGRARSICEGAACLLLRCGKLFLLTNVQACNLTVAVVVEVVKAAQQIALKVRVLFTYLCFS